MADELDMLLKDLQSSVNEQEERMRRNRQICEKDEEIGIIPEIGESEEVNDAVRAILNMRESHSDMFSKAFNRLDGLERETIEIGENIRSRLI